MERARLHGRFTPVIRTPSGVTVADIEGDRMPVPLRPSANPDAISRFSDATLWTSIHSSPSPESLSPTSVAIEKWCMVVATASEGERLPSARCTRRVSSAVAPRPRKVVGASRPGPPASRNNPMPGLLGPSIVISGTALRLSSRPGSSLARAARSRSRNLMSSPAP